MDRYLFDKIHEEVPKMNPLLCNGIAVEQIKFAEKYIDQVLRTAATSFPEGLEYVECRRCTPYEEYGIVTQERFGKQLFELARSDFYMVKYIFRYNGVELPPRHVFLPFLNDAGLITIRGSQFVVNPVIADKLFSVDYNKIFIPVTRDKLTFERLSHSFMTSEGRKFTSIAWSHIHHTAKKKPSFKINSYTTIKPLTTLTHYLFAKYGLKETFRKFGNTEIQVGNCEINEETYDTKEWIICKSLGLRPVGVRGKNYQSSDIRIAIKKADYNLKVESMIGAFFYIADLLPDRMNSEWIDQTNLWKITLGLFIYKTAGASEAKILADLELHLDSLDEYIDVLVKETLDEEDIPVNDLYELFDFINLNMTEMVISADVASMYGKRLTVLRYLLHNLVKGIFNLAYALKRRAQNPTRPITEADVRKALEYWIKPASATKKLTSNHGEVNTMDYPGDNKIFKITNRVILQSMATGNRNQSPSLNDASKFLHSSLAEVGSYLNQPKFDPTGQSRINPYLNIGVDGLIKQGSEFRALLDSVEERISRK